MNWAAFYGMYTEASYPYASGNGTVPKCDVNGSSRVKAKIQATGHQLLNQTEEYMAAFVAKFGPVSIALDDMPQLWFPYKGGIMKGCCDKTATHAVLIVSSPGKKCVIIKSFNFPLFLGRLVQHLLPGVGKVTTHLRLLVVYRSILDRLRVLAGGLWCRERHEILDHQEQLGEDLG